MYYCLPWLAALFFVGRGAFDAASTRRSRKTELTSKEMMWNVCFQFALLPLLANAASASPAHDFCPAATASLPAENFIISTNVWVNIISFIITVITTSIIIITITSMLLPIQIWLLLPCVPPAGVLAGRGPWGRLRATSGKFIWYRPSPFREKEPPCTENTVICFKSECCLNHVWVHVRYMYLFSTNLLKSGADKLALLQAQNLCARLSTATERKVGMPISTSK